MGRRITLIEDDAETRAACRAPLEARGWECLELSSPAEALSSVGDVVLVGLELERAFDLVRAIRERAPVVALSAHGGDEWLFPAIAAGCIGFVLKSEVPLHLTEVVMQAVAGEGPLSASIARRILERLHSPRLQPISLSALEQEMLALLAQGTTYEGVAAELGLSVPALRTYSQRLYRKLDLDAAAKRR